MRRRELTFTNSRRCWRREWPGGPSNTLIALTASLKKQFLSPNLIQTLLCVIYHFCMCKNVFLEKNKQYAALLFFSALAHLRFPAGQASLPSNQTVHLTDRFSRFICCPPFHFAAFLLLCRFLQNPYNFWHKY